MNEPERAISHDEVKGCLRKVRYEKRADAYYALQEIHHKRGGLNSSKKYCVYKCRFRCKGFHIGSKNTWQKKNKTSDAVPPNSADAADKSVDGTSTPIPKCFGPDSAGAAESGYSSGSSD